MNDFLNPDFSQLYAKENLISLLKEIRTKKALAKKYAIKLILVILVSILVSCLILALIFKLHFVFGILLGLVLGSIIGALLYNKPISLYREFYLANIPQIIASYAKLNVGVLEEKNNVPYSRTGLGDLYDYNIIKTRKFLNFLLCDDNQNTAKGLLYKVNLDNKTKQRVSNSEGRTSTLEKTEHVFSGYALNLSLKNPLDFCIRIDSDENLTSKMTEATIESAISDNSRFVFNTTELNTMFDCNVYPKNINPSDLLSKITQNHFGNKEKYEEAIFKTHSIITPHIEEFLMFVRKKFGPFTLVIGDSINIQISSSQSLINKFNTNTNIFKSTRNYISDLLATSIFTDSDIKCSRLMKMYDLFLLEFLLNKYFKDLTGLNYFASEQNSKENMLLHSDQLLFETLLNFNEMSDSDIDKLDNVQEIYNTITQKNVN